MSLNIDAAAPTSSATPSGAVRAAIAAGPTLVDGGATLESDAARFGVLSTLLR